LAEEVVAQFSGTLEELERAVVVAAEVRAVARVVVVTGGVARDTK
jgi:hypothetical protein